MPTDFELLVDRAINLMDASPGASILSREDWRPGLVRCLVQGVSPRVVMDLLGHSQIGLTMNTCTHVIPDLRREAARRMEDLLPLVSTSAYRK